MHWFGEGPVDEASQKLFDLRESGYDGWVDKDGNAVEDVDQWIKDHS